LVGTDPVQSQGRGIDGWLIIEESILTTITETLMNSSFDTIVVVVTMVVIFTAIVLL
jgi:hypothetical protein